MNARRFSFFSASVVVLASALAACGDDTGGGGTGGTTSTTSSTGGGTKTTSASSGAGNTTTGGMTTGATTGTATTSDASSSADGSSSTGVGPTTTFAITVRDAQAQTPVAGLDVCEDGAVPANCQTTDAAGLANLDVPEGADFTIRYSGAAYRPHLLRVRGDADATIFTLGISNTTAGLIATVLGTPDDATKGSIGGLITDGNASTDGGVAALDPDTGAGPFYTVGGIPNSGATETSSDGLFLVLNVDPGNPEVTITKDGTSCTPQIGVVGSTPNSTVVPVEAGAFTIVSSFDCL